METSILQNVRAYLDPTYLPPSQKIHYRWYALTDSTSKAALIQNKIIRYVVQFFALSFDAVIGCGLIGTLLYNIGAFSYNHLYLRIKKTEENSWNKTALKMWAAAGTLLAVGYGLYRLAERENLYVLPQQTTGILGSLFTPATVILGLAIGSAALWLHSRRNTLPLVKTLACKIDNIDAFLKAHTKDSLLTSIGLNCTEDGHLDIKNFQEKNQLPPYIRISFLTTPAEEQITRLQERLNDWFKEDGGCTRYTLPRQTTTNEATSATEFETVLDINPLKLLVMSQRNPVVFDLVFDQD